MKPWRRRTQGLGFTGAAHRTEPTETIQSLKQISCLLVCPTGAMRTLLAKAVRKLSVASIRLASNFDDAVLLIRLIHFDLIIWARPGGGHLNLLRFVRREMEKEAKATPFLCVTNKADVAYLIAARDAGVSGFMAMPLTLHDILRRISFVIDDPREFIDAKAYVGPTRRRLKPPTYAGPSRRKVKLG